MFSALFPVHFLCYNQVKHSSGRRRPLNSGKQAVFRPGKEYEICGLQINGKIMK